MVSCYSSKGTLQGNSTPELCTTIHKVALNMLTAVLYKKLAYEAFLCNMT